MRSRFLRMSQTTTHSRAIPTLAIATVDSNDLMQWFVVQTKPRQEERAQFFLAEKGLQTYLPRIETIDIRNHRQVPTQKALFPGYLFSRFDQKESLAHVRWTRGVVKILPESNRPQPLPDEIVDGIMRLPNKDGIIRKNCLKRRDKIRILKGPLKHLVGIFEDWCSDQCRVQVLLDFINYRARIVLHHSLIEKISS